MLKKLINNKLHHFNNKGRPLFIFFNCRIRNPKIWRVVKYLIYHKLKYFGNKILFETKCSIKNLESS